MSQTNKIITGIVVVTLIFMGLLAWWLTSGTGTSTTGTSTPSGIQRVLKSFFPFGNSTNNTTTQTQNAASATSQTGANQTGLNIQTLLQRLRQLSSEPVAGSAIFSVSAPVTLRQTSTSTATTSDYVMYVEKGTGHIYKELVDSATQQLISATTIPKIDTAFIGKNNAVAYQYFKDDNETLETFLGQISLPVISTSTSSTAIPVAGKVSGSFLPQDIYRFDIAPTGDRLFYLTEGADGDKGYVANIDGSKLTQVVATPLRELDISWPNVNTILLNSAPNSTVPGYLFALNVSTKNFSQVIGGVSGLTAIANPDLSYYIYSASTFDAFTTHVYRPKDNFYATMHIATLPEKCTWSSKNVDIAYCAVPASIPTGSYPESWYMGDVSFNDNLWKLDLKAGTSTEVLNFNTQSNGQNADMINLSVDQGDHYIIFTNKKDNTLWEYRLDATTNGLI